MYLRIGHAMFVWGYPGWGWKLYGVIWRNTRAFIGVSVRIG